VEAIMVERISLGFSSPDRNDLEARIKASIERGVTEELLREQKASFVYGNAPSASGITKESARRAIARSRLTD
jgi:hypothetical protein